MFTVVVCGLFCFVAFIVGYIAGYVHNTIEERMNSDVDEYDEREVAQ